MATMWVLSITLVAVLSFRGVISQEQNCGPCNREECDVASGCIVGEVPDLCGCCTVCGLTEGEKCDNASLPLPYKNKYGYCGDHMTCELRPDLGPRDPLEALCTCRDKQMVCGSDGRTYDSVCKMREESSKTDDSKLRLNYWGPCKTSPWIVSGPQDSSGALHQGLTLDCEVKGYPIPSVQWEFDGDDGKKKVLPSDDLYVAVQVRGGPEQFMVTSWVQIVDLRPTDSGVYTCVADNSEGKARASAKVGVYKE